MHKMKITLEGEDYVHYILTSRGKDPAKCVIGNLRIHEDEPVLQFNLDWINKGKYSNYQRKKMVARTLVRLLKATAAHKMKSLKHREDSHV
jgi:hypothetical protein